MSQQISYFTIRIKNKKNKKQTNKNLMQLITVSIVCAIFLTVAFVSYRSSTHSFNALTDLDQAQAQSSTVTFVETFNGAPTAPLEINQHPSFANWDIFVHHRDFNPYSPLPQSLVVNAHHNSQCSPAYDPNRNLLTHPVDGYYDHVFVCRDHMRTALNGGEYGAIYLTPNRMVDFTNGTATIKFDMSTFQTAGRDWIDVWITPYEDNLAGPIEDWRPALQGTPKRAVHFVMGDEGSKSPFSTVFGVGVVKNNQLTTLPATNLSLEAELSKRGLTRDAARRDSFEIVLSKNRIKVWMPQYNIVFADTEIQGGLDWSTGVVQFGHHSYNPTKDCALESHRSFSPCGPGTWHWDNISIAPAQQFSIIKADKHVVNILNPAKVTFPVPAPQNSFLRFFGKDSITSNIEISLNGGGSWQIARRQLASKSNEIFATYFTPIPAGTREVLIRGQQESNWGAFADDISIWSTTSVNLPQLTPVATPVLPPVPPNNTAPQPVITTPRPVVTATPTPLPTRSPIMQSTPIANADDETPPGSSEIIVRAAGQSMRGIVPILVAAVWDGTRWIRIGTINVGGDAHAGRFETYNIQHTGQITPGTFRLRFANDEWNALSGEDRNVRIQSVTINGRMISPTEPQVIARGTWDQTQQCNGGNKRSEWLHCINGYFIF